ncbi:homeodomain-only protein-like [Paramacrobiotus metropolitanus]|uniref:homeodomain-only protein-like n=1 Tax=Paramacrobiotus metropolitanus TaxID=2943436 RepID=UPI00244586AE|nr:homeodomain-only protein-like [Paramacrobiotus metropolitanus]
MIPLKARLANPQDLPRIRMDQEQILMEFFRKDKNPQVADINIIAAELGLQPYQIRTWYQHQLAYWRLSQGLPANNRKVYDIPQPRTDFDVAGSGNYWDRSNKFS